MKLLVLHGPNFNLQPEPVRSKVTRQLEASGFALTVFQANAEGALIDELQRRAAEVDAVLINPTSLAPVAHALAEAVQLLGTRAVEVQLVEGRTSVLRGVVEAQFHGEQAYEHALELLRGKPPAPKVEERAPAAAPAAPSPRRVGKSIGRAPATPTVGFSPKKTIGRAPAGSTEFKPVERDGPMLTRAQVRTMIEQRLAGTLAPEALAAWARDQWVALNGNAQVEAGQKDVLEDVLLSLAGSAKASEHVLLAAVAKLER